MNNVLSCHDQTRTACKIHATNLNQASANIDLHRLGKIHLSQDPSNVLGECDADPVLRTWISAWSTICRSRLFMNDIEMPSASVQTYRVIRRRRCSSRISSHDQQMDQTWLVKVRVQHESMFRLHRSCCMLLAGSMLHGENS